MTISDMLNKGADTLQKAGIEEYGLDAWYLLSYCMGINRAKYYMVQGDEADAQIIEKYNSLIGIRAERKPLQQITGSQKLMRMFLFPDRIRRFLYQKCISFVRTRMFLICAQVQAA